MRTTNDKLTRWVDVIGNLVVEECLHMGRILRFDPGDQDLLHVFGNTLLHGGVSFLLGNAFGKDKLIMLCRDDNRVDTQRGAVVSVFDRDLTLGIRTQIGHDIRLLLADLRQFAQEAVRQV